MIFQFSKFNLSVHLGLWLGIVRMSPNENVDGSQMSSAKDRTHNFFSINMHFFIYIFSFFNSLFIHSFSIWVFTYFRFGQQQQQQRICIYLANTHEYYKYSCCALKANKIHTLALFCFAYFIYIRCFSPNEPKSIQKGWKKVIISNEKRKRRMKKACNFVHERLHNSNRWHFSSNNTHVHLLFFT